MKKKEYIKVLKNGSHNGIAYKKGQILEVKYFSSNSKLAHTKVGATLSLYNDPDYGVEAVMFNSNTKNKYELWTY